MDVWEQQLFREQLFYEELVRAWNGKSRTSGKCSCAGQTLHVCCDANKRQWIISSEDGQLVAKRPIQGRDLTSLTVIPDDPRQETPPIQLTLSCFVA